MFQLISLILLIVTDEYQEGWTQLWQEHCSQVYLYYEQAYNDFYNPSHSTEVNGNSTVNPPVSNYDLSEHLRLLNVNESVELIVTVPENGGTPEVTVEDVVTTRTADDSLVECTNEDTVETLECRQSEGNVDKPSVHGADDSFHSACSDLDSSFQDAL